MRERVPVKCGTTPQGEGPAKPFLVAVAIGARLAEALEEWLSVDQQGGLWSDLHSAVQELLVQPRAMRALTRCIRGECLPPRYRRPPGGVGASGSPGVVVSPPGGAYFQLIGG